MAPPGRRRMSPLTYFLGLIFLFTTTASAASAVLGIDFGTEYITAALVKPGIPLEIVLTKDSKRKETSAVAFKPAKGGAKLPAGSFPERFYGGDAMALQARFPADVYPNLKQLLGVREGDDAVKIYKERYPAVGVSPTQGRWGVSLESAMFAEGEQSFSVEELVAMELENVKANAQALAGKGSSIEDVVFTVPPFYTVDERRALEVAAKLAGLKLLSVVSDGLAVGINYATSRTFPVVSKGEKPEIHLVFDMGAGHSSATVLKFQGKQVKDIGRFNKTVQEVQVLGVGWDRTLGGDALNMIIFNDMIDQFVQQPKAKSASITAEKVASHGRTAAKLWKDADKVRRILSANTQTGTFFEELYEEIDFQYKITRSKFEELAAEYAARIDGVFTRALEAVQLDIKDIDSVIVHGGATRTPFVQDRLEALVGKNKIKANVNSDEAAVFGAAFKAAGLSPSFRVKEIRDQDTQGYSHGIQYMFNLKDLDQKIFTPSTKIGTTKDLHFQMMGEFKFSMYQAIPDANGELVKAPVLEFESGNLTRAVTKLIDENKCDRESFNNYVQVRLSPVTGTPEVTAAWVTCETDDDAKGGIVDGIKGFFSGGKKDQEALKEGESASESASSSSESASASSSSSSAEAESTEAAKSGKKKQVRSAITYNVKQLGYNKVPRKEVKRMQDRLSAFSASDKSRRLREEALNNLEAFTYRARDYLEDESFIAASTAAARQTLEEKLSVVSDWIYAEGHDASEPVLKETLKRLKALVDPVLKRREESEQRPAAITELKEAIAGLKEVVPMVKENIASAASAAASASKAAEEASKSASASPSPSSADPLAELEDEPSSSSSSSSTADSPIPTDLPAAYTDADVTYLETTISSAVSWLESKEVAQKALSATEDAAFSVQELKDQTKKLNDVVMEMMMKKLRVIQNAQKPKAKPKPKKAKSSKAKKNAKSASSSASSTASADPSKQTGPSEEELAQALKDAGLDGQGLKLENLGDVKNMGDLKDKDGKPLVKLDLKEGASEEEIKEAIDRVLAEARASQGKKEEKHDEL